MQSPKLAIGTGYLQASTTDMQDSLDLDAVEEILSQRSNQNSQAQHASQGQSPAVSFSKHIASGTINKRSRLGGQDDPHSLAPVGPCATDMSAVIDLVDVPDQEEQPATTCQGNSAHLQATCTTPQSWSSVQANSGKDNHKTSAVDGTNNR